MQMLKGLGIYIISDDTKFSKKKICIDGIGGIKLS